jgi:hypothetical protein
LGRRDLTCQPDSNPSRKPWLRLIPTEVPYDVV